MTGTVRLSQKDFVKVRTLATLDAATYQNEGVQRIITDINAIATSLFGTWSVVLKARTWAQLVATATTGLPVGASCNVSSLGYQEFVWDGTNWRPAQGFATIAQVNGSVATPVATLSAVTAGQFTPTITVPAKLIKSNSKLVVRATVRKIGANATAVLNVKLGTAGTTADGTVFSDTIANVTNQDVHGAIAATFGTGTTSFTSTNKAGIAGYAQAAAVTADVSTNVNTQVDMKVSFSIASASASDSFALIGYHVYIE